MDRSALAFVGDELAAQGYRLAGALALTPAAGEELASFQAACTQARIVLLASEFAERLPPEVLDAARVRARPLVLVLPRGLFGDEPSATAWKARRVLGLEA